MTGPPEGLLHVALVLDVADEYREALAYDLLRLGLRLRDLGTERLSYGDVYAVIMEHPQTGESALHRALNPEWRWDIEAQLLATIADELRVANWQRARGKKRDYPKPIPRPGVQADKTYGKGAIPIDEMAEWLGWDNKEAA